MNAVGKETVEHRKPEPGTIALKPPVSSLDLQSLIGITLYQMICKLAHGTGNSEIKTQLAQSYEHFSMTRVKASTLLFTNINTRRKISTIKRKCTEKNTYSFRTG